MKDILVGILNIALIVVAVFTGFFIFLWVAVAVLAVYLYLRIRVWLAMRDVRKYWQQQGAKPHDSTIIDAEYEVIEQRPADTKTGTD